MIKLLGIYLIEYYASRPSILFHTVRYRYPIKDINGFSYQKNILFSCLVKLMICFNVQSEYGKVMFNTGLPSLDQTSKTTLFSLVSNIDGSL